MTGFSAASRSSSSTSASFLTAVDRWRETSRTGRDSANPTAFDDIGSKAGACGFAVGLVGTGGFVVETGGFPEPLGRFCALVARSKITAGRINASTAIRIRTLRRRNVRGLVASFILSSLGTAEGRLWWLETLESG
jgi:hypothetical protein